MISISYKHYIIKQECILIISIYLHINIFCFSYDTGNKSTKGRDQNTIFRIGGPASFLSYCKKLIFYKYIKTSPKVRARCGEITSITRSTSSGTCCPSPPPPGRGSPSSSWWRSSWSMSEKQIILKNVSSDNQSCSSLRPPDSFNILGSSISIFSIFLLTFSFFSICSISAEANWKEDDWVTGNWKRF